MNAASAHNGHEKYAAPDDGICRARFPLSISPPEGESDRVSLREFYVKQSGVMLLEALIALLIFSVGILAMIGMQAISIKNTASATYRSDASYLASQIIGQMWADQANLASYKFNQAVATCVAGNNTTGGANSNLDSWLNNDVARLPGSLGLQRIVIGANNTVTVTVCWQAPGETLPHNFTAMAQIN